MRGCFHVVTGPVNWIGAEDELKESVHVRPMQHPVKRRSHGWREGRSAMFWSPNAKVSAGGGGRVAAFS